MNYRSIDNGFITKQIVRDLLRQRGNAFLPDQVAEGLADRRFIITPDVIAEMAPDIASLVDTLRDWLAQEGIEPVDDGISTYNRRELMRGANLATLLSYHAFGLFHIHRDTEAAEKAIDEGLAWATFADDHRREALLHEARALIYSDLGRVPEEIESFEKGLKAARRPGDDPEIEMLILGGLITCLTANHRLDEAMELIDYGMALGRSSLSPHDQGRYLPEMMLAHGRILAIRNRRSEAIILLEEGLDLARSVDENHRVLTRIYYHLSQIYNHLGDKEGVLELHRRAIEIAERNEDSMAIVWFYLEVVSFYTSTNQPDLAEKGLDIAEATATPTSLPQMGNIFVRRIDQLRLQRRYDEALEYGRKIEALYEGTSGSHVLSAGIGFLAKVYCEMGELELAEKAYRRAIEIHRGLGELYCPFNIWFALTDLLLQMERVDEAGKTIEELLPQIDLEEMKEQDRGRLYELKGKVAEKKGDLAEALACTRESSRLMAEHYRTDLADSLVNARIIADCQLYRKEAEIQSLRRKEAETSLAQALAAFEDKRYALASVESQLRETLGLLNHAQARDVVGVLKQALDNIDETMERTDTSLHYLQTLDREFFRRLRERMPNLTRKQEHYCGLIRAGLSSKEIASILNLSTEGVRSQRKRIRKRLGLDITENLDATIVSI